MQRTVLFPPASETVKPKSAQVHGGLRVKPMEQWVHQRCTDRFGSGATLSEAILVHGHPDFQAALAALESQANSILTEMRYGKKRGARGRDREIANDDSIRPGSLLQRLRCYNR